MNSKPQTIDEYLARVPHHPRATLEKLRAVIKAALPEAEEGINYGMPSFRVSGKVICGFAASKRHCAFYPWSSRTVETHAADLERYETSKGTIRFPVDRPLPATLVRKLIKTRLAEIADPSAVAGASARVTAPSPRATAPSVGVEVSSNRSRSATTFDGSGRAKRAPKLDPRSATTDKPSRPKRPRNHGRKNRDNELDLDR